MTTEAEGYRPPTAAPTSPSMLGTRAARLWQAVRMVGSMSRAQGLIAARLAAPAFFMVALLAIGFAGQVKPPMHGNSWGDVYRYQCFAVLFWSGPHGLNDLPSSSQCTAVLQTLIYNVQTLPQSHFLPAPILNWMLSHSALDTQFHTLPLEYPVVSLIPFSLPLLVAPGHYPLAFEAEMLLLAVGLYLAILRLSGYRAAVAFALFMGVGAFATGADRFDLVLAALTFAALVLAERRRWTLAYVLLALATFSKFYPALLVLPLAVAQLRDASIAVRWWRRLKGLGWYVGVCAALLVASIAINPIGMYRQVSVFAHRPTEVESVPATLIWMGTWVHVPMQSFVWFGSDNVSSHLSRPITALMDLALLAGIALIAYAVWRGRMSLARSWLALLLLIIATGKIFSAQYLMWVFPFAVYAMGLTEMTALLWLAACALTTFSFPFEWRAQGGWHATIALRNGLVVLLTLMAMLPALRRTSTPAVASDEIATLDATQALASSNGHVPASDARSEVLVADVDIEQDPRPAAPLIS